MDEVILGRAVIVVSNTIFAIINKCQLTTTLLPCFLISFFDQCDFDPTIGLSILGVAVGQQGAIGRIPLYGNALGMDAMADEKFGHVDGPNG